MLSITASGGGPTNANFKIYVPYTNETATMDLSGLGTFTANLGTGIFEVGSAIAYNGPTSSSLILAGTSSITASKVSVAGGQLGTTNSGGGSHTLSLGSGTNTINTNDLIVGQYDTYGKGNPLTYLNFNTTTGVLVLRGTAGGSTRANVHVGENTGSGRGNASGGIVDLSQSTSTGLSNGNADLMIDALTISARLLGGLSDTSSFTFKSGTMNVNTLVMSNEGKDQPANSTLTLNGGNVVFNTGITVGLSGSTSTTASSTANFNVAGATVTATPGIILGKSIESGSGSLTSNLTISGGSLTSGSDIAVSKAGAGTITAALRLAGGMLDMGGYSIGDATNPITLTVNPGSGTNATLQNVGTINGTGGITMSGAGILTLAGTNSYTGPTTLSAGVLSISSDDNLNGTNSALNFNGGTLQITGTALSSLNPGRTTTFASGAIAGFDINNAANSFTVTQTLNQGTGGLLKAGAGTLILTASNSFTGTTTITGGTLQLGDGTNSNDGTMTTSGIVNNAVLVYNPYSSQTASYPISGSGSVLKRGSATSTLILNGANTFAGSTLISSGTLQLGNNLALQNSVFDPSGAGTLAFSSGINTPTFGGLTSSTDLILPSNVTAITLNPGSGVTATYGGNLGGGTAMSLTKSGSGIQVLTGSNSYTGATTLSGGVLSISSDDNLNGTNSALNFNGGTLQITGTALSSLNPGRTTTFASGAIAGFDINNAANSFTVTQTLNQGTGGLLKAGAGTLILTASNSFTGTTTITGGTLQLGDGTAGHDGSIVNSSITNNGTLYFNAYGDVNAGAISGTGGIVKTGTGTLNMDYTGGTVNYSGPTLIHAGTLRAYFNNIVTPGSRYTIDSGATLALDQAGGRSLTIGSLVGSGTVRVKGNLTLGGDNTTDANFTGRIVNSLGSSGVVKIGTGTQTLSGSNSYLATTVNAGILQVGNANALGGSTVTVNGGSLDLNGYNVTVGALSGSSGGTVTNMGSGTSTLTTAITATATYASSIADGTGAVALTKQGSGMLVLSGSNTHSGGTTVSSGTLQVGNVNALGTGGLTVNSGMLDLAGKSMSVAAFSGSGGTVTNLASGTSTLTTTVASGTSTYAGNIANGAGAVALTKQGAGKLILSGSLSMAGLTANSGVVELAQSGSIGAVTVSGSGAMALTAHSGSTYTVLDTSSLSITSGGSIDLWNNALILRASGTSENATNLTAVKASVNAASDGLKWDGVGLGSTTAYNEAQPTHTQALALMVYDNSVIKQGSFEGVSGLGYFDGETPVGFNQVLVKLTYLGDFNADGIVNASDYTWLDGFALGGNVLGDLNGDGLVNATDYTWLDGSALNQSFGVLAEVTPDGSASHPYQAALAACTGAVPASPEAVPEPGSLGLLLAGALGLLGLRRKAKGASRA